MRSSGSACVTAMRLAGVRNTIDDHVFPRQRKFYCWNFTRGCVRSHVLAAAVVMVYRRRVLHRRYISRHRRQSLSMASCFVAGDCPKRRQFDRYPLGRTDFANNSLPLWNSICCSCLAVDWAKKRHALRKNSPSHRFARVFFDASCLHLSHARPGTDIARTAMAGLRPIMVSHP